MYGGQCVGAGETLPDFTASLTPTRSAFGRPASPFGGGIRSAPIFSDAVQPTRPPAIALFYGSVECALEPVFGTSMICPLTGARMSSCPSLYDIPMLYDLIFGPGPCESFYCDLAQ